MTRFEYDTLLTLKDNLDKLVVAANSRANLYIELGSEHSECYGNARGMQEAYVDVADYLTLFLRGVTIEDGSVTDDC